MSTTDITTDRSSARRIVTAMIDSANGWVAHPDEDPHGLGPEFDTANLWHGYIPPLGPNETRHGRAAALTDAEDLRWITGDTARTYVTAAGYRAAGFVLVRDDHQGWTGVHRV